MPYLERFGLPGIGLGLMAWVIVQVTPHITAAIVQDRKNRRAHELALRRLEEKQRERERFKLPLGPRDRSK